MLKRILVIGILFAVGFVLMATSPPDGDSDETPTGDLPVSPVVFFRYTPDDSSEADISASS